MNPGASNSQKPPRSSSRRHQPPRRAQIWASSSSVYAGPKATGPHPASARASSKPATPRTYCIGEYEVGLRICAVSRRTKGPFFSVSANLASRSWSAKKPPHFFSRSARLSYARM